jgi:hypothetical protein
MSRFKKLQEMLERKGESEHEAAGVAAKVGMEKYGKAKFEKLAEEGRKKKEEEESAEK